MRILQLIDSLDAGGAERMAVSYANGLQNKISFSALCATRKEGQLKDMILPEVGYLFLKKKNALDLKAILKLRSYIKKNKIEFIHAHSSSFFIAVLLKFVYPKIKIVWHDHFGGRYLQSKNKNMALRIASIFFAKVLTINFDNRKWLEDVLLTREIRYFPNFISPQDNFEAVTELKGDSGKRIVFLANLRNPKNHLQFLRAYQKSEAFFQGWTIHLIGKDYEDEYSAKIKEFIEENHLADTIFLYGSRTDISAILNQSTIGVLCSTHEGFPVTLLEYGDANLAVLSTNVGFCSEIIQDGNSGFLFSPSNESEIIDKLNLLVTNTEDIISTFAVNLKKTVNENYTEEIVLQHYLKWLS